MMRRGGSNDSLSSAEIRAAMAKKSEEFKQGGGRDLSLPAGGGVTMSMYDRPTKTLMSEFVSQDLAPGF